ncbi:MAG: alpha/beta-type small acid-soluble spore protein [Ruminococcaceae bacterium]|nr:alpha/beta-type small acid-soluble spore protein [Oscillospiraceae bacterium]
MSSKNNNKLNVPEARAAMDKFKMEAAAEVGVDLKEGYNGHLTSREAGSVGGQMVKNNCSVRTVTMQRASRTVKSHKTEITYQCSLTIS